jgi:hypothetical protein
MSIIGLKAVCGVSAVGCWLRCLSMSESPSFHESVARQRPLWAAYRNRVQHARHKFKKWLFKRDRWTDEPVDGTEEVYFEPSLWERAKEWTKAFAQFVFALFILYAVPRAVFALYVGLRAFLRLLFRP